MAIKRTKDANKLRNVWGLPYDLSFEGKKHWTEEEMASELSSIANTYSWEQLATHCKRWRD
jgi:hypothetical protein